MKRRSRAHAAASGLVLTLCLWASVAAGADLPNRAITPGATDPAVTQATLHQTVCAKTHPTWQQSHRPPRDLAARIKREQIRAYGYADHDPRHYEEDHLVPISIGGLSYSEPEYAHIRGADAKNLWPEPRTTITEWGAERKDELEYALWKSVCRGDISLNDAQAAFTGNWIKAYDEYSALRKKYPSPFKSKLSE